MTELFGVAASLVGGFIGKRAGKKAGRKPWQKVVAPAAAFGAAAAFSAITGEAETGRAVIEAAGETGATAIVLHSVAKNVIQFLKD